MIHFFRNARKQLYTANKFSKYLVYAVGEIVLVVIGILIALQINNWNERQKRQEKNIQLLHRIHKELGQNIERSDDVIEYYRMVEGDFYTILNQKLTLEDYKSDEFLINIILTFTNVNLSDHDAKNLNSFNDNIDTAQDSLILRINKLYNNYKPLMDKLDEELLELTSEIIKKQRDTKAWFHLSDRQKLPDEAYSYFLNDPFYLNDVSYYQTIALLNHHGINSVFNNEAKNIYKDLSTYLQLKTDTTIIKQIENYQHYIGTYKHKEELIQIKQQADKLVYSHSDLGNETYDFYPTNDSLFNIGYRFGKLIRNENKEVTGMIRSLGSYEPKKYTKIE